MQVSGYFHAPAALPRYRLGGSQNRCGRGGEEKNPCHSRESNLDRPDRSLVTILTELIRVLNFGINANQK
jgi:hypothetical protein